MCPGGLIVGGCTSSDEALRGYYRLWGDRGRWSSFTSGSSGWVYLSYIQTWVSDYINWVYSYR